MKKYVVSGTDYDIRYKVGNIFKEYLCRKIKKYNEYRNISGIKLRELRIKKKCLKNKLQKNYNLKE